MARKKITELGAKNLVYSFFNKQYLGISYHSSDFKKLETDKTYVIKVDQGVKKRFKNGLIFLNIRKEEIEEKIKVLEEKGYSTFLIEEYTSHREDEEKYISIERVRDGLLIYYSKQGGVDIEDNAVKINNKLLNNQDFKEIAKELGVSEDIIKKIVEVFEKYYFSFLEINPLVIENNIVYFLDIAAEVDSAAEFFVNGGWTSDDFVQSSKLKTDEEKNVESLSMKSQAAFKLDVTNKDGSIFVLLSGGGASVTIADEIFSLGYGNKLGNYGEYSGNPSEEETHIYTKNLLSLLLKSKAEKKALIIGGGVANFTDVRTTFRGIVRALSEVKEQAVNQNIKVFVRRGGPNQEEGLSLIEDFLKKSNLFGRVAGPELLLTDIVKDAIHYIND